MIKYTVSKCQMTIIQLHVFLFFILTTFLKVTWKIFSAFKGITSLCFLYSTRGARAIKCKTALNFCFKELKFQDFNICNVDTDMDPSVGGIAKAILNFELKMYFHIHISDANKHLLMRLFGLLKVLYWLQTWQLWVLISGFNFIKDYGSYRNQ